MKLPLELLDTASQETATVKRLPAIIGRDSTADVRLDDPSIPPYQCVIGMNGGNGLAVWNLRDDSPIHVNGQTVTKADLRPGDRLTIGKRQLVVQYELAQRRAWLPA